jgi:deoxycytidine triphosphate deaminase
LDKEREKTKSSKKIKIVSKPYKYSVSNNKIIIQISFLEYKTETMYATYSYQKKKMYATY